MIVEYVLLIIMSFGVGFFVAGFGFMKDNSNLRCEFSKQEKRLQERIERSEYVNKSLTEQRNNYFNKNQQLQCRIDELEDKLTEANKHIKIEFVNVSDLKGAFSD